MKKSVLLVLSVMLTIAAVAQAQPRKILAIYDEYWRIDYGPTSKCVNFYDVTGIDLDEEDVLSDTPLFSVWVGGEDSDPLTGGTNYWREEHQSVAVNPANGMVYLTAYDSPGGGPVNTQDPVTGDSNVDYDLFRVNFKKIMDYHNQHHPGQKGIMYAPTEGFFDDPARFNQDHPAFVDNTVFIDDCVEKIGEIARFSDQTAVGQYLDIQSEFVDAATILYIENGEESFFSGPVRDFTLRKAVRVNKDPDLAEYDAQERLGGFRGGFNVDESWEAEILDELHMDLWDDESLGYNEPIMGIDPCSISEPEVFAYYKDPATGVCGVWVGESDHGFNNTSTTGFDPCESGDDIAFYYIDWEDPCNSGFWTIEGTDGKKFFELLDDPNDPCAINGALDFLFVNKDGELVIGESGYFDVKSYNQKNSSGYYSDYDRHQPKILKRGFILHPETQSVELLDWENIGKIAVKTDPMPKVVVRGDFVGFDYENNNIYYFDINYGYTGGPENYDTNLFVVNSDTGDTVYEEVSDGSHTALNVYVAPDRYGIFIFGDVDYDGDADADDLIKLMGITCGNPDAVTQETYDLTDDELLTCADIEALAAIVGVTKGSADLNGDGIVDATDLSILVANWLNPICCPGFMGDVDEDGVVDMLDFEIVSREWQLN